MRTMKTAVIVGLYLIWQTICSKISSGCLSVMGPCVSPDLCRSQQTLLRNICYSEGSECCNRTVQAILGHLPWWRECVCADEDPCSVQQRLASLCHSYLGRVFNKDCYCHLCTEKGLYTEACDLPADDEALSAPDQLSVAIQQKSSQASVQDGQLKSEWKASRLLGYVPGPNSSCAQELMLCVEDAVCNRQLVPFVQSCSEAQCDDSRCRLATRHFFTGLPQNVAEMLVFCPCDQEDQGCQDVQNTLHSPSCSGDHILPWNCLEMLDSCSGDEFCRQKLEGFLSKCFGAEDAPFVGYSTRDLLHLIDLHFFLSGDRECRMSFVATMGSLLQSPCTCHGLQHDDHYRCNMLQQAVQNRSHFRLQGTKRNATNIQSLTKRPGQSYSWFNDQLWFFLMYVFMAVVLLIVVAVVLHKLGRMQNLSKERRYSPPEESTKSLVL